jgi:type IX secretion system PorP/SprF family membrane protein
MFIQERATVLTAMPGYSGPAMNDPEYDAFIANQSSLNYLDIGAGLYFYSKDMYIGVSADQLTRDVVKFGSGTANFDPNIHFNFTAGYKFPLNNNLTLMPSVLVKLLSPAPPSIEGSLQFEYKEWLWFGASYRHTDAMVAMIGCNISERFKFGYSFDFSLSQFNKYTSGGHELILGLMLGR